MTNALTLPGLRAIVVPRGEPVYLIDGVPVGEPVKEYTTVSLCFFAATDLLLPPGPIAGAANDA